MQTDSFPICRVCLKTSLEYIDLESPFDSDSTQPALTYMDCFLECTRLNEEINYQVPQSICVPCGLDLRIAYEFLKRAENASLYFQDSIRENVLKVQEMQMENIEELSSELSSSTLTMEETAIKFEGYEEFEDNEIEVHTVCSAQEAYEINDALSKIEEEFIEYNDYDLDSISKPQSDDDMIDQLASEGDNDHSDTQNFLEVIVIDNEKNKIIDQLNENENSQEQITSNIKAKKPKRLRKTNKLYDVQSKKDANSSESLNICKICQKSLDDLSLSEHMEKFHMHIEECQHCEYKNMEFKVREHEKLMHPNKNNLLCYICCILNAHLKYHERKQSNIKSDACKVCGKKFSTQHYLRRHLDVHKNENERSLYKCDQCDKFYVTKYALDNHMKLHNGETIKCLQCDKQFSRKYELNVHMRFHTREYPFNCEVCGKKFAIKGHLRSHMWRHQGLKLQCEDCGKLFTSSKALLEHSYTHTEMPFPCCYCPKAYPSRQKFKVHLKTAHSIQLNEEELRKVTGSIVKKPLLRKKLTLVQADSVMKEVEVKTKDEEMEDVEDLVVELIK